MNELLKAWERTLRRHGDDRVLVQAGDGMACTFRQLDAAATAWLAAQRLNPNELEGRRVVFATPNGIRWFEIFLGLVKANAVLVPLDAAEPVAAQHRIATQLGAAFWSD